jgi:para-nitrobenzyl esterase
MRRCGSAPGGARCWLMLLMVCCAGCGPVVQTESGAVRGSATPTVASFKNIPYAAAPEGDWRWRPPRRAASWDGELDTTDWGPRCAQVDSAGKISGAEDCLRLNVWAPVGVEPGSRPVLVWIHGGSLVRGSAMSSSTDGERLVARTGVVLVSINYRLGAFGYFPHWMLASESGTTGNYGLLDQVAALEWVQRNITAFGGDPNRVAIFGQSAGGFSVCSLVASPLAKHLFSAAIMMSGGCTARTWNAGMAAGQQFVAATRCADASDTLACLRSLSMEAVLQALPPDTGYATVIDGYALTDDPLAVISRGQHQHVPVIVGNTSEEEGGSGAGIVTESDYRSAILKLFPYPTAMPLILPQYPVSEYASARDAYVAFASDYKYVCPARRAARALLAGQGEPVYRYVFSHVLDNATPEVRALGARHASDIPYIFDRLDAGGYQASDAEQMLVDAFARYFSGLATTGRIADPVAPLWPLYDGRDTYLRLETPIRAEIGYRTRQCDFWDYLTSLKP